MQTYGLEKLGIINASAVYRNLTLFKQQGLVSSIATVDGVERFDGNTAPHVHFICTSCGRVEDLQGLTVPQELNAAAARETGGLVSSCQLSFSGLCKTCINTH